VFIRVHSWQSDSFTASHGRGSVSALTVYSSDTKSAPKQTRPSGSGS
jgi:hypothetical protein